MCKPGFSYDYNMENEDFSRRTEGKCHGGRINHCYTQAMEDYNMNRSDSSLPEEVSFMMPDYKDCTQQCPTGTFENRERMRCDCPRGAFPKMKCEDHTSASG